MTVEHQIIGKHERATVRHLLLSAQDVIDVCTARPDVDGWDTSSMKSDEDWSSCKSLQQATGMLRDGWADGLKAVVDGAHALLGDGAQRADYPGPVYDVAGTLPDVPLMCSGDPAYMYDPTPTANAHQPVVSIYAPIVATSNVDARSMRNWGIGMLSLILATEAQGVEVELTVFAANVDYGGELICCTDVIAKRAGEPTDAARLAYLVAHPAMFRRSIFAVWESDSGMSRFSGYYGRQQNGRPGPLHVDGAIVLPNISLANADTPAAALETMQAAMEQQQQQQAAA